MEASALTSVQGTAVVVDGPHFANTTGKGIGGDLIVEDGQLSLQLVATNWLMARAMQGLEIGHSVHFEGKLESDEDAFFVVRLSVLRRITK